MKKRKEHSYNINAQHGNRDCQASYCNIEGMMEGEKIYNKEMQIDVYPDFFQEYYSGHKSAGKCPVTECGCFDDLSGNLGLAIEHTLYVLRKRIEDLENAK